MKRPREIKLKITPIKKDYPIIPKTIHFTPAQLLRPATGLWPGGWGSLGNTIPIQIISY